MTSYELDTSTPPPVLVLLDSRDGIREHEGTLQVREGVDPGDVYAVEGVSKASNCDLTFTINTAIAVPPSCRALVSVDSLVMPSTFFSITTKNNQFRLVVGAPQADRFTDVLINLPIGSWRNGTKLAAVIQRTILGECDRISDVGGDLHTRHVRSATERRT